MTEKKKRTYTKKKKVTLPVYSLSSERKCFCCEKSFKSKTNKAKGPAIFLNSNVWYCQTCFPTFTKTGKFTKLKDLKP